MYKNVTPFPTMFWLRRSSKLVRERGYNVMGRITYCSW